MLVSLLLGNLIPLSISSPPNLRVFAELRREEPLDDRGVSGRQGERRVKIHAGQREAGRSPAEEDEAPDLTALTHSGLLLLANCWLWSTLRGHTRSHIYLWRHTSDEPACVGECVATCDGLCTALPSFCTTSRLLLRRSGGVSPPPPAAPSSPASSHVSRLRAISSVEHKRSN